MQLTDYRNNVDHAPNRIVTETGIDNVFAILNGSPVVKLPQNLYIPPDSLKVFLDIFEGPLDLLLYLIRKCNLDIMQISISHVSEQYIQYINLMQAIQIELAADYLLMVAILTEIKSRLLLPNDVADEEEDEEDYGMQLLERLREYEQIKTVARKLDELPRVERDTFEIYLESPPVTLPVDYQHFTSGELMATISELSKRIPKPFVLTVSSEPLKVEARMQDILNSLKRQETATFVSLLRATEGRAGIIVAFLAIMTLSCAGHIAIIQAHFYAPIQVQLIADID